MMKRYIISALYAFAVIVAVAEYPAIVPAPVSYEPQGATVAIPETMTVGGDCAWQTARYLQMRSLASAVTDDRPFITALTDTTLAAEAYTLDVNDRGVTIAAADAAGLMYAVETLTQLLDQAVEGQLAGCRIVDSPRMSYRGLMLDVVRCYLPIAEIERIVDVASRLKINKLHLHLTDDNGWRMQINKYPRLTEVGAWRVDREELFPGRANPRPGEPATYGGYYTQDQLRRLVAYAAERNIEVIPEIEMPAHAIGAIASYPSLACSQDEFVGVLPGIGGPAAQIIMCAGNDSTITFVKDVLDEVMDVFPSQYIHLGGDEANKTRWRACPKCNRRIHDEHLDGYEELQGWFMDQIISYVRQHGRTAIGWDEVTYGHPKEDIIIMGWQGTGSVAEKYAAATGRRFIMTPALHTYLIRYQGPQWFEPFTYFGNITLRDIYEFDPVKPDWTDAMKDQLWGVQGSMWTEFCRTPQDVQYMVFPRLIGLADAAWRKEGHRDWQTFIRATDNVLRRFDAGGVNYARSMYNIQHTLRGDGEGNLVVEAECIRPDAVINVSTPGHDTFVYGAPFVVDTPGVITMVASTPQGAAGMPLELDLQFGKATGRRVESESCNNGLTDVLVNGLRGSDRNSDFEWAGWHNRRAEFTVDLGVESRITSVQLGALSNANMCVALPRVIQLWVAGDNGRYKKVKEMVITEEDRFTTEAQIVDIDFGKIKAKGRYVRVIADNGGAVPEGFPREGTPTWICFDEIIVK